MKEWLQEFKKLHDRFRANDLSGADRRSYLDARDQLASALMKAQGMQRSPGETARQAFRVAQAVPVEVRLRDDKIQTLTLDISRGGYSALMAARLELDDIITFTMKLPSAEGISGKAKVMSAKRQGVSSRFSFFFVDVPEQDLDRLETMLFDWALNRMTF